MQAHRRARIQSVIQEELSQFVAREVKDPRISPLTVTGVELTEDASQATVYVSLLGGMVLAQNAQGDQDEKALAELKRQMTDCLAGLKSASGIIRKHLAKVLTIRHTPALVFKEDKGLANATRVYELLKTLESEKK